MSGLAPAIDLHEIRRFDAALLPPVCPFKQYLARLAPITAKTAQYLLDKGFTLDEAVDARQAPIRFAIGWRFQIAKPGDPLAVRGVLMLAHDRWGEPADILGFDRHSAGTMLGKILVTRSPIAQAMEPVA